MTANMPAAMPAVPAAAGPWRQEAVVVGGGGGGGGQGGGGGGSSVVLVVLALVVLVLLVVVRLAEADDVQRLEVGEGAQRQ